MGVCMSRYGRIDILHNNVGASLALGDAAATDLEEAAFDRIVAMNLRGMWLACKHAIPVMRRQGGGSIVNISRWRCAPPIPTSATRPRRQRVIALTENLAPPTRATASVRTSSSPAS